MAKLPEIGAINFGAGAADHERSLSNYFYRNQAFDRACDAEVCLVIGEKGAGKSAIFLMMKEMSQSIKDLANPNFFVSSTANLREHYHLLRSKLSGSTSPVTTLEVLLRKHCSVDALGQLQRNRCRVPNKVCRALGAKENYII
jgi:hypothetical protein